MHMNINAGMLGRMQTKVKLRAHSTIVCNAYADDVHRNPQVMQVIK